MIDEIEVRMLEFLSKQKEKKEKIEKYLDYVSGAALPRIKEGNAGYLNSLQRVFTMKGAQRYHIEIADCFVNLLDGKTAKTLCQLDERCRGYSEYFWNWNDKIDWKAERLKRTELLYLSDRQYAAVLCVGTFHSDGYCRQACVEELKEYKGGLPFLVLRLNDWVQAVRESAYESALYRISKCEIKELFAALPMLEKVKQSYQ